MSKTLPSQIALICSAEDDAASGVFVQVNAAAREMSHPSVAMRVSFPILLDGITVLPLHRGTSSMIWRYQ
jgi:hypothetical protein